MTYTLIRKKPYFYHLENPNGELVAKVLHRADLRWELVDLKYMPLRDEPFESKEAALNFYRYSNKIKRR